MKMASRNKRWIPFLNDSSSQLLMGFSENRGLVSKIGLSNTYMHDQHYSLPLPGSGIARIPKLHICEANGCPVSEI